MKLTKESREGFAECYSKLIKIPSPGPSDKEWIREIHLLALEDRGLRELLKRENEKNQENK